MMKKRTVCYLLKKAAIVFLTLLLVTLLSFLLMRLSPVDPATAYVTRNSAIVTQQQIEEALRSPPPERLFEHGVQLPVAGQSPGNV